MAASQFNSPALLQPDGTIRVSGTFFAPPFTELPHVEVRFMLVQGDVVVHGTGHGTIDRWDGLAASNPDSLQEGTVTALGLAIGVTQDSPSYAIDTWNEEIDLQLG